MLVSSAARLSKCSRQSSGLESGLALRNIGCRRGRQAGICPCTGETPSSCDWPCRRPSFALRSPQQARAATIEPDRYRSRWLRERGRLSRGRSRRSGSRASKKREPRPRTLRHAISGRRGCAPPRHAHRRMMMAKIEIKKVEEQLDHRLVLQRARERGRGPHGIPDRHPGPGIAGCKRRSSPDLRARIRRAARGGGAAPARGWSASLTALCARPPDE